MICLSVNLVQYPKGLQLCRMLSGLGGALLTDPPLTQLVEEAEGVADRVLAEDATLRVYYAGLRYSVSELDRTVLHRLRSAAETEPDLLRGWLEQVPLGRHQICETTWALDSSNGQAVLTSMRAERLWEHNPEEPLRIECAEGVGGSSWYESLCVGVNNFVGPLSRGVTHENKPGPSLGCAVPSTSCDLCGKGVEVAPYPDTRTKNLTRVLAGAVIPDGGGHFLSLSVGPAPRCEECGATLAPSERRAECWSCRNPACGREGEDISTGSYPLRGKETIRKEST